MIIFKNKYKDEWEKLSAEVDTLRSNLSQKEDAIKKLKKNHRESVENLINEYRNNEGYLEGKVSNQNREIERLNKEIQIIIQQKNTFQGRLGGLTKESNRKNHEISDLQNEKKKLIRIIEQQALKLAKKKPTTNELKNNRPVKMSDSERLLRKINSVITLPDDYYFGVSDKNPLDIILFKENLKNPKGMGKEITTFKLINNTIPEIVKIGIKVGEFLQ